MTIRRKVILLWCDEGSPDPGVDDPIRTALLPRRASVISLTDRKTTLRYQAGVRHWLALSQMLFTSNS